MSSEPLSEDGFPWAWEHFKFIAFRDTLLAFETANANTAAALCAALDDAELLYDEVKHRAAFDSLVRTASRIISDSALSPDDPAIRFLAAATHRIEALPETFWKRAFLLRQRFLQVVDTLSGRSQLLLHHTHNNMESANGYLAKLECLATAANCLVSGTDLVKDRPLGATQAISLKLQSLLASVQHALPLKATSCLRNPSVHGAAIFERSCFVTIQDLAAMVERASGSWAAGRRDEMVKMAFIHESQQQLDWHNEHSAPELVPLNPVVVIDAALSEVANRLHISRGDKLDSTELEAVSTCFELEHRDMMLWVPGDGLPKAHFSKFILDMCCRGVDMEVFEEGLHKLMALGGAYHNESNEDELVAEEICNMGRQRYNQDRWSSQKAFLVSADHSGSDSRRQTERAREPGPEMSHGLKSLKASGTKMIAIAVEDTFVQGVVQDSESVKELRDKVCPVLNQAVVAAVAEGVQVALVSKTFRAETIQVLADSLFAPPQQSKIIVRCGGVKADLKQAMPADKGGHRPSEKLYCGSGKEVVVPGHVRSKANHKQWNLESAMAAIKSRGIHVQKDQCLLIDANESDVQNLSKAGYRAFLWDESCTAAALAV